MQIYGYILTQDREKIQCEPIILTKQRTDGACMRSTQTQHVAQPVHHDRHFFIRADRDA